MRELIERLEKLDGPDRAVDAEIVKAVCPSTFTIETDDGWVSVSVENPLGGYISGRSVRNQDPAKVLKRFTREHYKNFSSNKPYTASLDASIALVARLLPGCDWKVSVAGWKQHWAIIEGELEIRAEGATPAIALLIALLRALSKNSGEQG